MILARLFLKLRTAYAAVAARADLLQKAAALSRPSVPVAGAEVLSTVKWKQPRVVTDVSERVARGLPLSVALSVEDTADREATLRRRANADYQNGLNAMARISCDIESGRELATDRLRYELARRCLLKGMTVERVAVECGLTVKETKAIQEKLSL
jgi:hypothetical protein